MTWRGPGEPARSQLASRDGEMRLGPAVEQTAWQAAREGRHRHHRGGTGSGRCVGDLLDVAPESRRQGGAVVGHEEERGAELSHARQEDQAEGGCKTGGDQRKGDMNAHHDQPGTEAPARLLEQSGARATEDLTAMTASGRKHRGADHQQLGTLLEEAQLALDHVGERQRDHEARERLDDKGSPLDPR